MQKRPLVTTMMTTGGTALLGDVVCQTAIEKNGYQPARSLVLAGWAAGFTGPFMLGWLRGLERVMPSSLPPAGRLLGKATLEMAVAFPIILAGFFGGVTLIQTGSPEQATRKVSTALWPTLKMGYAYFGPASLLTHAVIPTQHRVLFLNFLTFFWLIYLSNVQHTRLGQ